MEGRIASHASSVSFESFESQDFEFPQAVSPLRTQDIEVAPAPATGIAIPSLTQQFLPNILLAVTVATLSVLSFYYAYEAPMKLLSAHRRHWGN